MSVFIGLHIVYVQIDDAAQVHEPFGLALATRLDLRDFAHVRGSDVGELNYALLAGVLVLGVVAFGWLQGAQLARTMSADLAVLMLALGACGVGADLLHQMLLGSFMDELTGVLEDGGEMLVVSLTFSYVLQLIGCEECTATAGYSAIAGTLMQIVLRQ